MNIKVIIVSIPFLLAGFSQMNEWVTDYIPWLPWLLLSIGILGILTGVFWDKLVSLRNIRFSKAKAEEDKPDKISVGNKYGDCLSVVGQKVDELTIDRKLKQVTAIISIFSRLECDISVQEFKGSARLNAFIISKDLKLTELISTYHFTKEDITQIQFRFGIESDVLKNLEDKRRQKEKAWWEFDLQWHLKHPSGEEFNWELSDIHFEEIPRIG